MAENVSGKHKRVVIDDRSTISIDGVKNVLGFDEGYISCETELGKLIIEGKNLKIESLVREGGEMRAVGEIEGVYYSKAREKCGFLSGFFK